MSVLGIKTKHIFKRMKYNITFLYLLLMREETYYNSHLPNALICETENC